MILGHIDVPDDLISSIFKGDCVIFAGAGVSKGPPANLPLFAELAERLAGKKPPKTEPLDHFLGRIGNREALVDRTLTIIRTSTAHNPLHEHLVRLFQKPNRLRVVTTNYDQHFESAARKVFDFESDVFHAPALPLGRSFRGIVHVHGSVLNPDGIVLTDVDFGRAYLTEGWARRFLVELFQNWDVLFVGYSHDDMIMDYLARALPPSPRKRYALDWGTDKADVWKSRGILAIPFGNGTDLKDFDLQSESLRELAGYIGRSAVDWTRTMVQAVKQGPPHDKAALSQLVHALKKPLECKLFLEQKPDARWVSWLDDQGLLHGLSNDESSHDECRGLYSHWMSHQILHANPRIVLNWMMGKGCVSRVFWHHMTRGVLNLPVDADVATVRQTLGVLVALTPNNPDALHLRWVSETAAKRDAVEVVIELFKIVSVNGPSFTKRVRLGDDQENRELDIEPAWRFDHHHLQDIIDDLRPHLDSCALRLFHIVCEVINQRFILRCRWDMKSKTIDADSYRRAAIEQHAQDRFLDECDPIINLGRDLIQWMSENESSYLRSWISAALTSTAPLIRRLAVHGMTVCPGQSADDILSTLLKGLVEDIWCRHEIFMAIKQHYNTASVKARQRFIDALRVINEFNPDELNEKSSFYHFQWAGYIALVDPLCALAANECRIIKDKYPDIRLREYPDLTHWTSSSWGGDPSPVSVTELLAMTPEAVIAYVHNAPGNEVRSHDLSAYYENITKAAEQNEVWAKLLLDSLLTDACRSERICNAILRSLVPRLAKPESFPAALTVMENQRLHQSNSEMICSILKRMLENDPATHVINHISRLDTLAIKLWLIVKCNNLERTDPEDWLQAAINSSSGNIAEYLVASLSIQCRATEGSSPPPMPDGLRALQLDMVSDLSINGGLCRTVIASQSGFIHWLDPEFFTKNILPLFLADSPTTRLQVWQGFLVWGRLYPALAKAMQAAFEAALDGDHHIFDKSPDGFAQYLILAGAMISDQCAKNWMLHRRAQDDRKLSHAIARQGISLIRDASPDLMIQHWRGWLGPFWKTRLLNFPQPLDGQEISALLEGLDYLEPVINEAAALLDSMAPMRLEYLHVIHGIHEKGIDVRHPLAVAKILEYLLRCEMPSWSLFNADKCLKIIIPKIVDAEHQHRLINLAIERGAIGSTDGIALLSE